MSKHPFDLTGKVALVSGGNSGIGLGMAEGLARCGADVVIWGRNKAKNADVQARLAAHGTRILIQEVEVSSEAAVVGAIGDAIGALGRLDFVAANAGIHGNNVPFADMTTEAWRRVTEIDLDSVFWTLREACRHMVERAKAGDAGGSLAATSSTAALHGAPGNQSYAASKAGLVAMIRGIAVEYARFGIRANAILPGWVRSDMSVPMQGSDKFTERVISRVPLRRWGDPEDFGGIASYLAADVSRFHTGDQIVIDGGYTIY